MTTPHLGRAEAARSALLPAEDLQLQILLALWVRSLARRRRPRGYPLGSPRLGRQVGLPAGLRLARLTHPGQRFDHLLPGVGCSSSGGSDASAVGPAAAGAGSATGCDNSLLILCLIPSRGCQGIPFMSFINS